MGNNSGATGVDENGNPASGYRPPNSWGSGWTGATEGNAAEGPSGAKSGRFDRWLHKATSHPQDRSGQSGDLRELRQERQQNKLRRRSGNLKAVDEQ